MRHRSYELECTPESFQSRHSRLRGLRLRRARRTEVTRCARLWREVGAGFWSERARWGAARWRTQLTQPSVSFWIASLSGEDAGCFELTRLSRWVKIQGFGLLPSFRGRGLGRDLLAAATELAFEAGAPQVRLHTATDDHPAALPNYLAGGYRIVRAHRLSRPMKSLSVRAAPPPAASPGR